MKIPPQLAPCPVSAMAVESSEATKLVDDRFQTTSVPSLVAEPEAVSAVCSNGQIPPLPGVPTKSWTVEVP